jgi:Tfp pilus assembly protein PilX
MNKKGTAIAAVVVFMFIFTILGAVTVRIFTAQNLLTAADTTHARVFYAADAGIEQARNQIVNTDWGGTASEQTMSFGDGGIFDANFPRIMYTVTVKPDPNPLYAAGGWTGHEGAINSGQALGGVAPAQWKQEFFIITSTARTEGQIAEVVKTIEYRFIVRTLVTPEVSGYQYVKFENDPNFKPTPVPAATPGPGSKHKYIFRSWREL